MTLIPTKPGAWNLAVTCTRGLEEVLRAELLRLGHADARPGRGVVTFCGGAADVLRANLWLRTGMRVLRQLAEGRVTGREELYELASGVAWDELIAPGQTLVVEVAGQSQGFRSSAFAALTVKDACVDQLRRRWGFRPDVAREGADVRIHLHLTPEGAGLALDATGEPLSHRGYRPMGGPAPLAESLAAGMLLLAGYDGAKPLLDPMCGTGTIAIEAALIATGTAPGLKRSFACERWRDHDAAMLADLRADSARQRRAAAARVAGSDLDPRAVSAAERNADAADVRQAIGFGVRDVRALELPGEGALVVTNPPYGQRLGEARELEGLYRELGDALKRRAAGATAWVLAGNLELAKFIGLRASRRIVLWNGPIECRLLRFDLYRGRGEPEAAGGGLGTT